MTTILLVKELGGLLPQLKKHGLPIDIEQITRDYNSLKKYPLNRKLVSQNAKYLENISSGRSYSGNEKGRMLIRKVAMIYRMLEKECPQISQSEDCAYRVNFCDSGFKGGPYVVRVDPSVTESFENPGESGRWIGKDISSKLGSDWCDRFRVENDDNATIFVSTTRHKEPQFSMSRPFTADEFSKMYASVMSALKGK